MIIIWYFKNEILTGTIGVGFCKYDITTAETESLKRKVD